MLAALEKDDFMVRFRHLARCEYCQFFERGECHRNAPFTHAEGAQARWPQVAAEHWCGDFKSEAEPADLT